MTQARMQRDPNSPAKLYLMDYTQLHTRRDALQREVIRLRDIATRATGRMEATRLSGTPYHGGRENEMLRLADADDKLIKTIDNLGEALAARLALIDHLTDERHKTLLTLRYINGIDWEHVGYEMHYERTQVFELHGAALRAFGDVLKAAQEGAICSQ